MKTPVANPLLTHGAAGDDDATFSVKEHARHTLFCGTQVIQTRYYGNQRVRAVVIRTGMSVIISSFPNVQFNSIF
jgi:cation-transporting ATPase 13A2